MGAEAPDFYQPGTQRFSCTGKPGAVSLAGLDLVPLCVTFLFCFWEVQYGIVAGVLVSGVLLLYSIARPPLKVGCSPRVGALGPARLNREWGAGRAPQEQQGVARGPPVLPLPHPESPASHRHSAGTCSRSARTGAQAPARGRPQP